MRTYKIVIGDSKHMKEVEAMSIGLIVTSPPYYVMRGEMSYSSYDDFLRQMRQHFKEMFRVLKSGRCAAVNISDYVYEGKTYPIPFDFHCLLTNVGFDYVNDIIWQKPSGMTSLRVGGVFKQNPYPMFYYPNNIYEHILIFRKGDKPTKFHIDKIDLKKYKDYLTNVWYIPAESDERHRAIFPIKLPELLIEFYSFKNEVVLDPFLGSGTTMKAAKNLGRSCIGYEINGVYLDLIKNKVGWNQKCLDDEVVYDVVF